MGEVMWLEVLGRHREVLSRQRFEGPFTVGRAYDNDLILDDPTVAANHLTIARDETGAWIALDRGSVNGLYLDGSKQREARIALTGNEVLRVGRTLLRVRGAQFAVAPERPFGGPTRRWPMVGGFALALAAIMLLDTWLSQTTKSEVSSYVGPITAIGAFLLVWTGFWALITRLFAGQARFDSHLLVAIVGLLASVAVEKTWKFAAFTFAWPTLFASAVMGWFLVAAIAYAHLRVIGPGRLRIKAASVLTIAVLAVGLQWLAARELEKSTGGTVEVETFFPPAMRIVQGKDSAAFFTAAEAMRARVDKKRADDIEESPPE
jgi:Inner membrane component of T3SS, cytoplasmic domain